MSENNHIAKAYLLLGCPFCFKFLLFMTEAGLLDQIEVVSFDPKAEGFDQQRAELKAPPKSIKSFPSVEIEPGLFQSETDILIDHYAKKNNIDLSELTTFEYYGAGVFKDFITLFMDNREFKKKLEGG